MFLCKFLGERISQIWWVNTKERKLIDHKIRVSLISQESVNWPSRVSVTIITHTDSEWEFCFFLYTHQNLMSFMS